MTDIELMDLPKVGVKEAAAYLQNGTTPQQIRVWARAGHCPFCQSFRASSGSQKLTYRIHIGNLIAYKHGEKTVPMTPLGYA